MGLVGGKMVRVLDVERNRGGELVRVGKGIELNTFSPNQFLTSNLTTAPLHSILWNSSQNSL